MAIGQYNSLYTGRQIDEAITKALNWIQKDEIKTDMLADSSVTANKLADSSVTTNKILDEAIGLNKLSKDLQGKIGEDFVNSVIFEYGLKDSIDITDDENVIDTIYGNAENDFGIRVLYHYDDIYDGGNTPIDYSFLIVGAEKKDGVAVVSQTLIKSNGQILYRDMSHPDSVAHEWSEWKSICFTEEDAEVLKNEIEAKINAKPGKIRSDGAAVFENTIENGDVVIAVKGDTIAPFARDLSYNMTGWARDGMCIGIAPEDIKTFESLEYIYVTYNGEPLKLKVGNFTNSGLAADYWGDTCIGANLYVYFYNNNDDDDFNFMEEGLVQENLEPIGYCFENAFEVKKSGEVKSPTIDAGLIVCSAEGEHINVNDSAELPLKKLSVLGKTKQLKSTGKNMIPFPFFNKELKEYYPAGYSTTDKGITFLVNEDGSVSFWGTATADVKFRIAQDYGYTERTHLPPGTYIINAYNSKCYTNTFSISLAYKHSNKEVSLNAFDYNTAVKTFTIGDAITDAYWVAVDIVVKKGYRADYETVYPMLEKGSTASPYEPYTGGKPSPSPEWIQPLKTAVVTDEFIHLEVSDEAKERTQSFILSPFNGLWGVPVSSGGNYTDSDGQQWICNELDLVRGVYIERVVHETIGTLPTVYTAGTTAEGKTIYGGYYNMTGIAEGAGLCTVASYVDNNSFGLSGNAEMSLFNLGGDLFEVAFSYATTDEDSFRYVFEGQEIILLKKAPTETPLSAGVLAQCKALHGYNPTTNIVNDKGALMVVEYVADTKTYIDNKFAELQAALISLGGNV